MPSLLSTALIGAFALGSLGGNFAQATSTPEVTIEEPTYQSYTVSLTGYNAVPEQTDGNPDITASGVFSDPDVVAARSKDLADELPFGTVIALTQTASSSSATCGFRVVDEIVGLRVIADAMHPRKRNQVDIMFHVDDRVRIGGRQVNPARALGVCKNNIEIKVVGHVDMKHMPHNQTELRALMGAAGLAINK